MLLLLGAACGDIKSGPETFLDDFEEALCAGAVACHQMPDIASCRDSIILGDALANLLAAVDSGRVAFDADLAEICLAMARQGNCTITGGDEDALGEYCAPVFAGTVQPGGACYQDLDCAGDGFCDTSGCTEQCCQGTCMPGFPEPDPVPIGSDCTEAECVPEAYCSYDVNTGAATCAARVQVGGTCTDYDACVTTAVCAYGPDTGAGTCIIPLDEGEPCDPESFDLACNRVDNYCDPATLACKRRPGPGEACNLETGIPCLSYAACNAGTCVAQPERGEACNIDIGCLGDLECVGGVCRANEFEEPVCP